MQVEDNLLLFNNKHILFKGLRSCKLLIAIIWILIVKHGEAVLYMLIMFYHVL